MTYRTGRWLIGAGLTADELGRGYDKCDDPGAIADQPRPRVRLPILVGVLDPLADAAGRELTGTVAIKVDELLIVDPAKQKVDWLTLHGDSYQSTNFAARRAGIARAAREATWM